MMRQKEEGFLLWPNYFIAMSGFLQLVSICRTLIGFGLFGSSEETHWLKSILC